MLKFLKNYYFFGFICGIFFIHFFIFFSNKKNEFFNNQKLNNLRIDNFFFLNNEFLKNKNCLLFFVIFSKEFSNYNSYLNINKIRQRFINFTEDIFFFGFFINSINETNKELILNKLCSRYDNLYFFCFSNPIINEFLKILNAFFIDDFFFLYNFFKNIIYIKYNSDILLFDSFGNYKYKISCSNIDLSFLTKTIIYLLDNKIKF